MLANPLTPLRRLPRDVRALMLGTLVNRLGSFIFPFLSLVLSRELQLGAGQVAGLLTAYGLGAVISILLGGVLTDSLGRRRTLQVSLFGSGVVAIALGCAPGLYAFVPLLMGFAFLSDLYRPASAALISDRLPSEDRALGYAALRMAANLGFFVGMGLGGVLVDWNWRVMFVADGLTTLACGLLVHWLVVETRPLAPEPTPVTTAESSRVGPDSPWRDAPFLWSCFGALMYAVAFFADFTALPLTITRAGYPAWVFGLIVGTNGLLIALFEVTAVDWLRRFRRLRVAAVGALVSGLGFGMVGLVGHWAWFLLASVLWTVGEILTVPQQTAFVADWAPPHVRGRYLSIQGATWAAAAMLSPGLLLPLQARIGDLWFWPLLLVLNLPAAAIFWRLDRSADQPERLRGRD